ncbi:epidermis-specific secreted glycoprotein EP1-like [Phalaenopsis equestris]|uniref:epidermis-specific secreted glycoprotein EP1-like n=1 Tax=Phalaenopsis equestris TaxID=78828 RepID=UPI0009E4608F|nr:epidermis-specific secreted glycoprotein EP1-like [Phalaenopsis equestris]
MASASLLLLLFTSSMSIFLPLTLSQRFDYPTANLSTLWTLGPSLAHNISYPDGSTVLPLLLRGNLGPSFAFGFFCYAPCSTFLLSIYIVYTNSASMITNLIIAPPRVVWSANPNRPAHLNATVLFSSDGDLILRDADSSVIWSTSTSGHGAENLSLLDSGNLVVLNREGRQLWDSFDHPTDSLLLGQSLSKGQRLTANSSATNATTGQLYVEILDDGLHAFIDSNPPQLYYAKTFAGSSKSKNQSTFVTFNNGSLDIFVLFLEPGVPDISITLPTDSSCQYLRLEDNGHFRLYGWNNGWKYLAEVFDIFPDDCAYPTVCGQYGICSNGQCTCPQSADGHSNYFKPLNSREINLGCSAVTPISCKSIESHQFLELDSVSYFNSIDPSAITMNMADIESCKQACLRNCSCKAALFQYGGNASSGSCYLPSQIFSLMDNKPAITHYNSSAFIKVQAALLVSPSPVNDTVGNIRFVGKF